MAASRTGLSRNFYRRPGRAVLSVFPAFLSPDGIAAVCGLIPGNRWRGGAPEKKKDTLSTLAAPAARRRAMLSGAIRLS
ncbi:hypothetical protein ACX4MT_09365, partial [Roseomonas mucosa]